MDVSGHLNAPAALPKGKETLVPTGWEAGWWQRKRTYPFLEQIPVLPARISKFRIVKEITKFRSSVCQ
jgi:hypothetical protein